MIAWWLMETDSNAPESSNDSGSTVLVDTQALAHDLRTEFSSDARQVTEIQATGIALNACGFGLISGLLLSILLYKVFCRG